MVEKYELLWVLGLTKDFKDWFLPRSGLCSELRIEWMLTIFKTIPSNHEAGFFPLHFSRDLGSSDDVARNSDFSPLRLGVSTMGKFD